MSDRPDEYLVDEAIVERLVRHATDDAPCECCGLLIGLEGSIRAMHPTSNAAPSTRRRYLIEPADHFAAIHRARAQGLAVIGAYHSHPAGTAEPSETDRQEAFPDFLFVIVGLGRETPDVRGWEWRAGNFVPVRLVRTR